MGYDEIVNASIRTKCKGASAERFENDKKPFLRGDWYKIDWVVVAKDARVWRD